jgi:hypothetical protein
MKISNEIWRRRAVAGIISAVILFALVFTVGTAFFYTVGKSQQTAAGAYSDRLSIEDQAALENLTLTAGLNQTSKEIWLMVNNTGGIPSTIESVYVAGIEGKVVSNSSSTGAQFLKGPPDISRHLPLTLDVGASTAKVGGNIQINQSAFDFLATNRTVFVNVLTSLGNVFSIPYPALNTITFKNVVVNQHVLYYYLSGQYYSDSNGTVVISGCYSCVSSVYAGGNLLVLLLTATPSPVAQGGAIYVNGTVWDYSAYAASSAEVFLNATYSGTASVTPSVSNTNYECGSSQPIASGGSAPFECTFTANTGASGSGTVTFVGRAKACVDTPSTSSPCPTGTPVSSSITGSDPVQIGTLVTVGLWQPNYYYYEYSAEGQSGLSSLAVISHTHEYVAAFIQLTNIYTEPLTILDGTYIQSVSASIDFDFFMGYGSSATYPTGGTPSFSPYGCSDSAPLAPVDTVTGQSCMTVNPGQTVTLIFVAAAPGGSSWEWGSAFPGGSSGYPGGDNMQILVDFAAYNAATNTYSATSQDIPFEGLYVT